MGGRRRDGRASHHDVSFPCRSGRRRPARRLGGAYNAAMKTVQHQANELKRKANGASWAKAIPSFRMTVQQKQDAARLSGFLGGNVWTLHGFGSCAELVMELRR